MRLIIVFFLLIISCSSDVIEKTKFIPINNIEELSTDERTLLFKVDSFRQVNGKKPFILDKLHSELALKRNIDNSKLDSISHEGFPDAYVIFINLGLTAVGENLGHKYSSAKTVFEAWVKSNGHIINLLSDAKYTGASRLDTVGTVYYCQIFSK